MTQCQRVWQRLWHVRQRERSPGAREQAEVPNECSQTKQSLNKKGKAFKHIPDKAFESSKCTKSGAPIQEKTFPLNSRGD